jgi:DNA-binding response OmpR family regulator
MDGSLLAGRLKAHLRRLKPAFFEDQDVLLSPKKQIKCDEAQRRAWVWQRGAWKCLDRLTETEFRLLCLFLKNPGAALDRRFILETVWGTKCLEVNPETVDRHLELLRKKLGTNGQRIKTLYGVGYALRED